MLPVRVSERQIDDWVAKAWDRSIVEPIADPEGYVAECDAAPGAVAFGRTAEEARAEMRTVLIDWAALRVERGYSLPHVGGTVATAGR